MFAEKMLLLGFLPSPTQQHGLLMGKQPFLIISNVNRFFLYGYLSMSCNTVTQTCTWAPSNKTDTVN